MTENPGDVVVVGAGVSGTRFAQALRRSGHGGRVTLVSAEAHPPYDRPPLSKDVLKGEKALADIVLATPEDLTAADIVLRTGRAVSLDREGREIVLEDGERVPYDTLVIATGARPIQLHASQGHRRVLSLGSIDDCQLLRKELDRARSLAMVGAGFIGSEIAATARQLGLEVTLIGGTEYPLDRVVGPWVGGRIAALHARHGVDVRMLSMVQDFVEHEAGITLRFADGDELDVDIAVVGVGAEPNTDWLSSSGLEISGGVVVDGQGRTADPRIWAIGDIARVHGADGSSIRHEHWTSATEQADALARHLTGRPPSRVPSVDYVWTDLYDTRLQVFGTIPDDAEQHVLIEEADRFLVAYSQNGRLAAMLGMGVSGTFMRFRGPVAQGAAIEEVLSSFSAV